MLHTGCIWSRFPHLSPGADISVPSWADLALHSSQESYLWWPCQDRDIGAAGGLTHSRGSKRMTCKAQFSLMDTLVFFLSACTLRNSQSFLISKATLSWGQDRNENRLTCLSLKGTFTQCSSYSGPASSVAPRLEPKRTVHAAEQDNGTRVGKERMNHYSLHKSWPHHLPSKWMQCFPGLLQWYFCEPSIIYVPGQ